MSWFYLKDQPIRKRRVGIWIRVRSLPNELGKKIAKIKRISEHPWQIKIAELRPKGEVLLEMWCSSLGVLFSHKKYDRNIVYHFVEKEDPDWVCEGDLGRGLNKARRFG